MSDIFQQFGPPEWYNLPLEQGVIADPNHAIGGMQYCRIGHIVFLRGGVIGNFNYGNVHVGTLPVGYRPTYKWETVIGSETPDNEGSPKNSLPTNRYLHVLPETGQIRLISSVLHTSPRRQPEFRAFVGINVSFVIDNVI